MAPPLPDTFKGFLKSLSSNSFECASIGGDVAGIYRRALAKLSAFGFAALRLDTGLFLVRNNIVRMGVPPIRIEILTSISGVEFESCYAEKQMIQIEEMLVPVISLARLRENKAAAGRTKDLADLESLAK